MVAPPCQEGATKRGTQEMQRLCVPDTMGQRVLVDGGGLHGIVGMREAFAN